ncbi:hypothetical protein [Candidatus Methanoperedens sp. BLZ2]|uniref:hypothetical protein n=1 Tax=Candidatus Methanoperedens sp. BLZ2 TaxID=2035255 RepID=UPI000BE2D77D|nr:hypothetical protein [Candidatus Methanoperedens sp. BLZ2]KAB2940240.1 MAG: hypothetical protein F9K14_19435 [Candidatus Methanoperedens sp.]MBZ0175629.1 hypothetical protein [Candidatus Methanoperedens nitroreducens]WAH95100.1 MAG: hypothetical protein OI863_00470 [Candidatus Methanoperedens sp.]
MPKRDFKLLNPWYSEQIFILDDGKGEKASFISQWSENIKEQLELKKGAMGEWETHSIQDGIPILIYHELLSKKIFDKEILWISLGIEPKNSYFGQDGFYDDISINFAALTKVYNNLFSSLPITFDDIFLKYTYLTHDFNTTDEITSKAIEIAEFTGRSPLGTQLDYCSGKISKLGGGKPPKSRCLIDEIGGTKEELAAFIYPDIFIINATPHKMYYHDSAQKVVSYHTLLKNLGLSTAIYKELVSIYKRDGSRILDILEGLSRADSVAFSIAWSINRRRPPRPLGNLNELAEIIRTIHLEGLEQNWVSLQDMSLYPSTTMEKFLRQLLGLRAAVADESLLLGNPVGPDSKPVCFGLGEHLFPNCDKGMSLLNAFAHLSSMIYENIRKVSLEEDFKNLIVAVLAGYKPLTLTEAHHGGGIADILVPCSNKKFVVIECKVWRYQKQIKKNLEQISKYIGPDGNCGFLVYYVPNKARVPLIPLDLPRKNLGYDSVCSSSDAIVEIEVPGHSAKVPIAVLFLSKS